MSAQRARLICAPLVSNSTLFSSPPSASSPSTTASSSSPSSSTASAAAAAAASSFLTQWTAIVNDIVAQSSAMLNRRIAATASSSATVNEQVTAALETRALLAKLDKRCGDLTVAIQLLRRVDSQLAVLVDSDAAAAIASGAMLENAQSEPYVFPGCTLTRLALMVREVTAMFVRQYALVVSSVDLLQGTSDREQGTVILSAMLHQPYINEKTVTLLLGWIRDAITTESRAVA
ncbi:hypothetical protein CAOG_08999 [Capsaspora owczarzaki ATCC 30864]|uniref:Uncharacterized protein n=1 Tax=Capsaspora owczarzaki (strain ATCC 30864) TaxID=595528 RepID=A0A0D2WUE1_CAPO3|nr:hypothetical protein CAOG_08999 [Capsaspora owczarzaki ATCC 30864]KJE96275.1 hypothetical protein CAOG_008999 [Capsaspora owczarzaki ATCC 30864]|eukprot:XP_011270686.1 hypothetical protein CAOG_08999 [Capsaspora owczarzaki ATCC 30864]